MITFRINSLFFALVAASAITLGQTQSKPPTPPAQKKTAPSPPAPQSKHYPILLIASGSEPFWSLRIGMKGAERLERVSYPPIQLDPGEIEQEGTAEAWLYHAKDSATQADATVRVAREACSDNMSDTKYSFRVVVTHAQIGELKGCAKISPDQFPEFKQKNLDEDDPEKKKITPPAITNFKPPTAVAYLDPTGKVVFARGEAGKLVAPKGSQLSLSHDGKRLLYTREDSATERTVVLYDAATAKAADLIRGAQSAFWSPDDSQIAFLKVSDGALHVWTAPANAPDKTAELAPTPVLALHGWQDLHTVLATDSSKLYFLKTESPPSSAELREIYGSNFQIAATDALRVSPANSDLLAVSATGAGNAAMGNIFLYEFRSKRRVAVTAPTVNASNAEWSRDGIQVFFTLRDAAKNSSVYRIFWDGSGLKRIRPGSNLVIGQ